MGTCALLTLFLFQMEEETSLLPTTVSPNQSVANATKSRFSLAEQISQKLPLGSVNHFRAVSTILAKKGICHSARPGVICDIIVPIREEENPQVTRQYDPDLDQQDSEESGDEERSATNGSRNSTFSNPDYDYFRAYCLSSSVFEPSFVDSTRRRALEYLTVCSQIGETLPEGELELPKTSGRRFARANNFFAGCSEAHFLHDLTKGDCWIDSNQIAAIASWSNNQEGPHDTRKVFTFFMELLYSWQGAADYVKNIEGEARVVRIRLKNHVPPGRAEIHRFHLEVSTPKMARVILWLITHHFPISATAGRSRTHLCDGAAEAIDL